MQYAEQPIEKHDADYICNRLGVVLVNINQATENLKRQANKLFGYQPEGPQDSTLTNSTYAPENMPALDLIDHLDKAVSELQIQANRF